MERNANLLKLSLGTSAPYFSLPATDGKIYSLSDYIDKIALVVIFTSNQCPYCRKYEQILIELANQYQPIGVQFVAICSNDSAGYPEENFERMIERSRELCLPFPYLHDEAQNVATAYDAACTPEVYLFDDKQRLCYHGRIDNSSEALNASISDDLKNAIEAVISGQQPKIPLTPVIGCTIKWK